MPAAPSHRRVLLGLGVVAYAFVFIAFLIYEKPGLGIGHFYYFAIALLALASGPRIGALSGVFATVLYVAGVLVNPRISPTEVLTSSTLIRLLTYAGIGALLGWFASNNRALVERLEILAERDSLTGLPNTRAFEAAITRRLEERVPFALLIGDIDRLRQVNELQGHSEGDDALYRIAQTLGNSLEPTDEIARVGGDEFAVLAGCPSAEEAGRLAARLEAAARSAAGSGITFGWAVCPQEGANALTLYRIADERLYARKLIRGERRGNTIPFPGPRAAIS
jgi:diguanylate cyclase (GGDEF)-like protein